MNILVEVFKNKQAVAQVCNAFFLFCYQMLSRFFYAASWKSYVEHYLAFQQAGCVCLPCPLLLVEQQRCA